MDTRPTGFTNVPGTIQEKRIDAIESMITAIHNLITEYSGPNILCEHSPHIFRETSEGFFCDANLLGSLLKASAIIGIWPRPEDPYPGIKLKTLADQIRGMRISDNCEVFNRERRYCGLTSSHGVKDSIEASVRSLEDRIVGLDLMLFLPKTG